MKEFTTITNIQATPDSVWAVLTNGPGYADWNPEIVRVDGNMALNQRLKAHVNLGKGVIRKVGVCVTEFEPGHRMVWTGGMPFGLFTGRRTFTLEARDSGLVEFKMHLHFSGLCAGPISRSLGDRQPDIDAFAAGLKKYAER